MTIGPSDVSSYVRGRLQLAGIDHSSPVGTVLDVLLTIVTDVPTEALERWRKKFQPLLWKIRPPNRESWGTSPEQQAAMAKLAGTVVTR